MKIGNAKVSMRISSSEKPLIQSKYNDKVDIQFYGMFGSYLSICCVCHQFAKRLIRDFENVGLHNTIDGQFNIPEFNKHAFVNPKAPIGIFYGVPNEVPDSFFRHGFTIGGFVCETNRIHKRWVDK